MAKTILLVEDSPEAVDLSMNALLECWPGPEVVVAYDGQKALDWLFGTGEYKGRDTRRRPQLVLLDLRLPKVSGFEVLKRVRLDDLTALVPVVMLTVSELRGDMETAYRLGANSFLVKPLDYDIYAGMVRKVCDYWLTLNESPYP